MTDYKKRIKDRLNALKSQMAEVQHPKLTKHRDSLKEAILTGQIYELENLLK